jgi:hypothetical protein
LAGFSVRADGSKMLISPTTLNILIQRIHLVFEIPETGLMQSRTFRALRLLGGTPFWTIPESL